MPVSLSPQRIAEIEKFNLEQRLQYTIKEIVKNDQVWILTDAEGCMMLTIDDEDGIPVWPNEIFAKAWAMGDWEECEAKPIQLQKWLKDWTPGMLEDELSVVVFPNQNEEGVVLFADEFDFELKRQIKKKLN
ncbi:DUF2750 domain-containing protein [Catenovulum maritimum]|uniref:Phage-shock protein n=1 Tax=Catenovulum maritimum TaxID=1513271 RepID=A0A0J8H0W0_9ALTE|nr:DUF2750 domain-containing protein [Catenovulum maritimum]KMT66653.1 phage-shock protein [Catenovulum maritimum]